jgi:tRNA-specific 2-thiouridylase
MSRILVWLSWGVDSAVAAALLIEQWHEVIAGFMKNYADTSNPNCQTKQDRDDAIAVARHLGIKTFLIQDFCKEYDERILQYIYRSYAAWLTPNPDVFCNSEVKFDLFLELAVSLGCDAVATGHYARVVHDNNYYTLLKWVDSSKDQSYFLSRLSQYQLSHALFPLWSMLKSEVRNYARTIWLPNADKKDSQGLCFVGKVSMKEFLSRQLPKHPGIVYDVSWNKVWSHDGIQFYTLGQRIWLWWWSAKPYYIVHKDVITNTIIVGYDDDEKLLYYSLVAHDRHRISDSCTLPFQCNVKVRYRQEDQPAQFTESKDWFVCTFSQPQRAVSSWQIVVAYDWDRCLWSGIIA